MANDINVVTIVARLVHDAELKETKNGTSLSTFSVAVNKAYSEKKEVSYFDVKLWGKTAEATINMLKKGVQVVMSGELQQERWEQNGQSRSKVVINCRVIQVIYKESNASPNGVNNSHSQSSAQSYTTIPPKREQTREQAVSDGFSGPESFDDDIPF